MGAKQSSPTAANGRTRAYSGGDLPSSSSSSSGGANGTGGRSAGGGRYAHLAAAPHAAPGAAAPAGGGAAAAAAGGSAAGSAPRSRSLGGGTASGARAAQSAFNIPHSSGPYGSQDSVSSTPEEGGRERPAGGGGSSGGPRLVIGSLPAHLSPHLFGGKGHRRGCGRRDGMGGVCVCRGGEVCARLPGGTGSESSLRAGGRVWTRGSGAGGSIVCEGSWKGEVKNETSPAAGGSGASPAGDFRL